MPWCEPCAKYWTPNAMKEDGTCPKCGAPIGDAHVHDAGNDESKDEKAPWHFKLMIGTLVVYLTWRMVQVFSRIG